MGEFKKAKQEHKKVSWQRENLIVDGRKIAPTNDDQNFASSTHVQHSESESRIHHGNVTSEQGSSFQAHLIDITNKDNVIPTMHRLYANHNVAKATHNIYAYRIADKHDIIENSCDDGEYGAGRKLLQLMQDKNIRNRMIVVTRWYGGKRMGGRRYQCILEAAEAVVKQVDE